MKSETEIRVRGYHVDLFGHVNHARYIEFLEEGRWTYMERNNLNDFHHKFDLAHAVVNITINYRKSAVVGDSLLIETMPIKAGSTSFVVRQKIFHKESGTLIAEAEITNVFLNQKTGELVSITEEMTKAWTDLGKVKNGKQEARR